MYATVFFYKYNKRKEGIFVTYPNMQYEYLADNDTSPYIFTYPQFQIDLEAGDRQGEFSFKVVWSYYPTNLCQNNIDLDASSLIPSVPTNCLTTFTAPNRVWLVGFLLQGMQQKELRQSAVYEGGSYNGTY
uniref:CUB_2 domain-containing protein n=1 Tax=Caenorhabditis tropicalis TaxID=1561998 RepID=A0A1I7U9N1_9PELO